MTKKFKVWLDSGANIHSCNEQTITLDEVGIDDEEWETMSEKDRDEFMREVAFGQSDWGYTEIEEDQ